MTEPLLLGVAGSPRRGGNSDRLLAACMETAEAAGARTARLTPSELDVSPCLGCNACSKDGECAQRDSMTDVYRMLDGADAIVVASPVFFAGVPAPLKALVDRLQPYWARRYVLGEPVARRRPGGIILVGGGGDPYGFQGAEDTLRSAFAILGIDVLGALRYGGLDAPGDAVSRPDALREAAALGTALAGALGLGTRSAPTA